MGSLRIDPARVEDIARELYIRALKVLPPDVKQGFSRLASSETDATAQRVLGTMIRNIAVAEDTDNLLCQDTGIPIYNVTIGRGVEVDGAELERAIRRGCERATREYPLRSSVVHPITRKNAHTSCGPGVPPIHIRFSDDESRLTIEMMREGWFAPTLNLDNPDPRCSELDYIVGTGRELQTEYVMSNNFAFGGINTSLIFKRWRD